MRLVLVDLGVPAEGTVPDRGLLETRRDGGAICSVGNKEARARGRKVVRRITWHNAGICVGTRAMTPTGGTPVITPGTDRVVSAKEGERIRRPIANDPAVDYRHRPVPTRITPRIPGTLRPDRSSLGSNRLPPRQP